MRQLGVLLQIVKTVQTKEIICWNTRYFFNHWLYKDLFGIGLFGRMDLLLGKKHRFIKLFLSLPAALIFIVNFLHGFDLTLSLILGALGLVLVSVIVFLGYYEKYINYKSIILNEFSLSIQKSSEHHEEKEIKLSEIKMFCSEFLEYPCLVLIDKNDISHFVGLDNSERFQEIRSFLLRLNISERQATNL